DSGLYYTVVGPMTVPNAEMFVNDGPVGKSSLSESYYDGLANQSTVNPEYLFLVNGVDDNGDGYIDNGVNGVNENQNFAVLKSGVNPTGGIPIPDDLDEWIPLAGTPPTETETFQGSQATQQFAGVATLDQTQNPAVQVVVRPWSKWIITRRPVPVP